MGPGPNNCPGIRRGKDTIEGEDEEDEEGEKGREEERKEGGSDSVEIGGDFGSQPKGSSNVQIAQSPGRVSWDHNQLLHNEVKCQWENRNQSRWFNLELTQSHIHSHLRSPREMGGKEICHE